MENVPEVPRTPDMFSTSAGQHVACVVTVCSVQEGRRAPAGSAVASLEGRGLQNETLSTGGCRTSSTMFWRDPEDGPSSITPTCKYLQTEDQTGAL